MIKTGTKEYSEQQRLVFEQTASVEFPKSNFLIASKYRASLKENKLLAIALSKLQSAEKIEEGIAVKIKAAELRTLLRRSKSNSFYKELDDVAKEMTGRVFGYTDPERKFFDYMAVVNRATYENGEFTVIFNYAIKNYLMDLTGNFTKLNLYYMLIFNSVNSLRLYELLKSRAFSTKNRSLGGDNTFIVKFNVYELKLCLGIVNAELDSVKRILNRSGNPDYEKAVAVSPEKTYDSWSNFRKKVLDPARVEINEKTEISIDYSVTRSGQGGKVTDVTFIVKYNDRKSQEIKEMEELLLGSDLQEEEPIFSDEYEREEINLLIDKVYRLWKIDIPISRNEIHSILKAANYDYYIVYKVYHIMLSSKQVILDPVRYMIEGCKKNYVPSQGAIQQSKDFLGISEDNDDGQLAMDFT